MRVFTAVELPAALRQTLADGIAGLRRTLPAARWVRPEGLHLTLKFLDEQERGFVERFAAEAADVAGRLSPVEVALSGGGVFPSPARPRVAWVGGRAEGLDAWAAAIDEIGVGLGVEPERRRFSCHLTLARFDRPWPEDAVHRFVAAVGAWVLEPFTANEIVLFESRLQPGGAVYSALRRWPVGAGGRIA